jgi:hypothetical protein
VSVAQQRSRRRRHATTNAAMQRGAGHRFAVLCRWRSIALNAKCTLIAATRVKYHGQDIVVLARRKGSAKCADYIDEYRERCKSKGVMRDPALRRKEVARMPVFFSGFAGE